MIRQVSQLLFFVLCFFSAKEMTAQKMYDVTIELPASMSRQNLIIQIDDGTDFHPIADSIKQTKINFKGEMYSDVVTLYLQYNVNSSIRYNHSYFVNDSPAIFVFKEILVKDSADPFQNCTITNALNISEIPLELQRRDFIKEEGKEMNIFLETHHPSKEPNDSFQIKYQQRLQKMMNKQLEFIKKYPNEYYSFYLFRTQVVYPTLDIIEYDSLEVNRLNTFLNTVFPKKFTKSREGEALRETLKPRQPIAVNVIAPDFEAKDIHGNKITLHSLRGKYILLDFWATWCPPCMEQIPFIKSLRDSYSEDDLVIIGVSGDHNRSHFDKVIKEKQMDWMHIYDKTNFPAKFNIRSYPTLILINDQGVIMYIGNHGVEKVKKLLEER